MLAEWGSVQLLERELRQQGKKLRSIIKAPGLWYPHVNSNTSAVFTVDRKRHLVSLASMFGNFVVNTINPVFDLFPLWYTVICNTATQREFIPIIKYPY